jgi:hypothetical protein
VPSESLSGVCKLDFAVCSRLQNRTARRTCASKSVHPLQLLHVDVCGHMPVESLGGARSFMNALDDFSRLSVVRCMSRKARVPEALKSVIALLETQSSQRVQRIRSDEGGEFVNNSLM